MVGLALGIFCLVASLAGCRSPATSAPAPATPPVASSTEQVPPPVALPASSTATPSLTAPPPPQVSGLRVIYGQAGNLWLWENSRRQLTASGLDRQPGLSPDGRLATFLRQVDAAHDELWVVELASGQSRRLVGIAELEQIGGGVRQAGSLSVIPHRIAWVPGTHLVAFNTRELFQGPGWGVLDDFNLVEADSGQLSFIFLAGWGGGEFSLSPNGEQVAISTPTQVILARRDGSDYRIAFTYPYVMTYGEIPFYARPRWSPDGNHLWLALPPTNALADLQAPTQVWSIPARDGQPAQVGEILTGLFLDSQPDFSPDLSRLAFTRPEEGGASTLWLAEGTGANPIRYARGPLLHWWGWAPAGERFLYSQGQDDALYVGQVGGEPAPWPGAGLGLFMPRWVSETSLLAYLPVYDQVHLDLYTLDGGALRLAEGVDPLGYDFTWMP